MLLLWGGNFNKLFMKKYGVILFTIFTASYAYTLFEHKEIFADAGGLCGAFTAETESPSVIYYNPAGLFDIPKLGFYFSYTNLYSLPQLQNNTLSLCADLEFLGKVGLLYNNFGFELYKENFLSLSYANGFSEKISFGLSLKLLALEIKHYGDKFLTSADFGVLSKPTQKLLLGFVVKNINIPYISPQEKVYHTLVAAAQYRALEEVYTYFDIVKPTNEKIFARIGEEIKLKVLRDAIFILRAGIESVSDNKPAKYSVGFGVNYLLQKNSMLTIDYSYIYHTVLGGQHIASVAVNFGVKEKIVVEPLSVNVKQPSKIKRATKQLPTKPININTATVEELTQLPGIGPSTAEKIVEYRQQIGKFTSVEQLLDVPRIGTVTLQRIKPYITLGEEEIKQKPVEDKLPVELTPAEPTPQQRQIQQPSLPSVVDIQKKEEKYNINTISVEQLEKLGFTSIDAKNIVRYRTKVGKFKSVEELYKIPNIDYKILDRIKPILVAE
ncbi:MAG: helix-hairpin-helix domain-containing protein [Endomicrobia bacterium]|nr:helix-hairpin-helix domain-containing protein [Endomicrobiia bacterium]